MPEAFCSWSDCACICVCVCVCINDHILSLLAWYLINCLGEFYQIYNFSAVGHRDDLVRFWGQKVKDKDHNHIITYGAISTLRDTFSPVYVDVLMQLITITHHKVHVTMLTFWVLGSKVKVTALSKKYTFPALVTEINATFGATLCQINTIFFLFLIATKT